MHGQLAHSRTCSSDGWAKSLLPHCWYVCVYDCVSAETWQLVQKKKHEQQQQQQKKWITSFKQSHPEILLCTFRAGKSLDNHRAFSGRVVKQTSLLNLQGGPRGHLFSGDHRSVSADRKPQAQSLDLECQSLSLPALDFVLGLLSAVCPSTG